MKYSKEQKLRWAKAYREGKLDHSMAPAGVKYKNFLTMVRRWEKPVAFMGIEDGTLEMLFISPEERGKGLGKRLLQYGIKTYAVERVAVNEQNPQAKGFYEHLGFQVYKRTDLDEQGNPYPLLYMSLNI